MDHIFNVNEELIHSTEAIVCRSVSDDVSNLLLIMDREGGKVRDCLIFWRLTQVRSGEGGWCSSIANASNC